MSCKTSSPPPGIYSDDVLRDVVEMMLSGGGRHAEIRVTFGELSVRLHVTLAAAERPDGTSALSEEQRH